MSDDKVKEILCTYAELVELNKTRPSYADFTVYGITRDAIRSRFGGIEKLHQFMDEHHSSILSDNFLTLETAFSDTKSAAQTDKKMFIITTAVADSAPHKGFLDALDMFAEKNNAQIVIMPCESATNSFEKKTAVFDKVFGDSKYLFVSKDTPLNDNLCLCSIQVSAKQIRPITGLSRIGNREGSFIFASTKQFLEFVPSGNRRGTNYSIMTTGACTLPAYYTDTFVSKRLSYLAEKDHMIGAIIVELEDDKIFHFRQIQAAEDGSFIDFGLEYTADNVKPVRTNIVFGDLHSSNIDQPVLDAFLEVFKELDVKDIFLHDVFDGYSINHHVQTISEKASRSIAGTSNLKNELKLTFDTILDISNKLYPDTVHIVKSNHDEFLSRYLAEGKYAFDPENHYTSLKIAPALFEGADILGKGFQVAVGSDHIPDNWIFWNRSASVKIGGVECASHGDLGLNGAKPSLTTLEKVYGNCVVGHTHSGAIHRGVFRVGTLSKLDLGYNRGPTSWTQTCCLIYENGQRQLINMINLKCRAN